eukprot:1161000-Pelagomonas_calceolata.AAC.10
MHNDLVAMQAKPVRTASGIAVVAVMSKPHRCPHIATTGNICIYCPGGPDSDFEYSTQSYTGYEPTSMRAIRARYDPYVQVGGKITICPGWKLGFKLSSLWCESLEKENNLQSGGKSCETRRLDDARSRCCPSALLLQLVELQTSINLYRTCLCRGLANVPPIGMQQRVAMAHLPILLWMCRYAAKGGSGAPPYLSMDVAPAVAQFILVFSLDLQHIINGTAASLLVACAELRERFFARPQQGSEVQWELRPSHSLQLRRAACNIMCAYAVLFDAVLFDATVQSALFEHVLLMQARSRVDQLRKLGHSVDKVGHLGGHLAMRKSSQIPNP